MKRTNKKQICIFGTLLVLTSCTFTTGGNNSSSNSISIDVDKSELETIMEKYDNLGYQYDYDGEECTLTMAHWDSSGASIERQVVEAVLSGFKKRYPKINVTLDIIQSYEDTYGNRITAGTAHDVFLTPDGAIPKWAGSNKLENLNPYISSSSLLNLSQVYSSCLTRYQYNPTTGKMGSGNQLALPKDVGPYVMYYNKDWFTSKGVTLPPKDRIMTIDEATEMWQQLTKYDENNNITGYGVAGLPIEGLVWSGGGDFLNSTRDAFPTDEASLNGLKQAYQYMQDSYCKYKIQPPASFTGTTTASNLFTQQKVATVISGRWEVSTFRSLSFNWDIAYVPAFTTNPTKNMYSGSVGYAINSQTSKKLAAWKLIEYIASKEGQEILATTGFQIPVYEDLALEENLVNSEKEKGPENYEVFVESAKNQGYGLWQYRSNTLWKENGYDLNSEKLYAEVESERISVDEFLQKAKNDVNKYCK